MGQTSQRLAPHRRVQKPGLPVDPIDHGTTQDQRLAIDANALSGSGANAADENEDTPGQTAPSVTTRNILNGAGAR